MLEDRKVYVYISLEKQDIFVGTLWSHFRHGDETASFEYDKDWLANPNAFSLEPSLELFPGQYHTKHKLFGAIGDSAPDRWGRTLMRNNEIDMAKAEKRSPRTLNEIDYLYWLMIKPDKVHCVSKATFPVLFCPHLQQKQFRH